MQIVLREKCIGMSMFAKYINITILENVFCYKYVGKVYWCYYYASIEYWYDYVGRGFGMSIFAK
jgi:hypothetical protein